MPHPRRSPRHAALLAKAEQVRLRAARDGEVLKQQFLTVVSHELRTPLNAMMGFGSILADELLGPLNPRQRELLERMLASTDHMLDQVDDLLDLAEQQAGRLAIAPTLIAPGLLALAVLADAEGLAATKGVRLVPELPAVLPPLVADPARLGQALAKLVANALKFTPSGGLVRVRAYASETALVFEVADTGEGIMPEDLERLFHRFGQLDMTPTRRAGGLGIGLVLAKALVEAHGGAIGVRSQAGVGSTFWLTLPLEGPVREPGRGP